MGIFCCLLDPQTNKLPSRSVLIEHCIVGNPSPTGITYRLPVIRGARPPPSPKEK